MSSLTSKTALASHPAVSTTLLTLVAKANTPSRKSTTSTYSSSLMTKTFDRLPSRAR